MRYVDFYPRSPCGERQATNGLTHTPPQISIHALLAESDNSPALLSNSQNISIHALLAESDPPVRDIIQWEGIFLSTLSLRRATGRITSNGTKKLNFYPRSPCGERPSTMIITTCTVSFLSTLSLRRATNTPIKAYNIIKDFYPRSPCGERRFRNWPIPRDRNFYPRSPCGERQQLVDKRCELGRFLSTLSLRRATSLLCYMIHLV